jgi:hypothetical protein
VLRYRYCAKSGSAAVFGSQTSGLTDSNPWSPTIASSSLTLKLFTKLITVWCPPNGTLLDPFGQTAAESSHGDANA